MLKRVRDTTAKNILCVTLLTDLTTPEYNEQPYVKDVFGHANRISDPFSIISK